MKNKSKKTNKNFQKNQLSLHQLKAIKGGNDQGTHSIIIEDIVNG